MLTKNDKDLLDLTGDEEGAPAPRSYAARLADGYGHDDPHDLSKLSARERQTLLKSPVGLRLLLHAKTRADLIIYCRDLSFDPAELRASTFADQSLLTAAGAWARNAHAERERGLAWAVDAAVPEQLLARHGKSEAFARGWSLAERIWLRAKPEARPRGRPMAS